MTRTVALQGGGPFVANDDLDRRLLAAAGATKAVVLPTADAFEHPDFRPNDAIEFWDMTNKQDWHVCELSQQGIASRAYQPGPYSPRESIPAAWDREYLRRLEKIVP